MKKLKKFLTITGSILVLCVLCVICLYWFLTSSFFLTNVALPHLSKTAGIRLEAKNIDLRPLSGSLEVSDFAVGEEGKELATGAKLRAKVDVWAFLFQKTIVVDELFADFVNLSVTTGTDSQSAEAEKTASAAGEIKLEIPEKIIPWKVQISNVKLDKCNFTLTIPRSLGESAVIELSELSFALPRLANGEKFEMDCRFGIGAVIPETLDLKNGECSLKLSGELAENILPHTFTVNGELAGLSGTVRGKPWQNETYALNLDVNFAENVLTVSRAELAVKENTSDPDRNSVLAANTFDATVQFGKQLSGKGSFRVGTISPQLTGVLIDLFCDGYNPGDVNAVCSGNWVYEKDSLRSEVELQISRSGDLLVGKDRFELPELAFSLKKSSTIFFQQAEIEVKDLTGVFSVDGRDVATVKIIPVRYNWEKRSTASGATVPDLQFNIDRLDLAMIAKFVPEGILPVTIQNGEVSLRSNVFSDDEAVKFTSAFELRDLSCNYGNIVYDELSLKNSVGGVFTGNEWKVYAGKLSMSEKGNDFFNFSYEGSLPVDGKEITAKTIFTAQIQPLLELLPLDGALKEKLRRHLEPLYPLSSMVIAEARWDSESQQIKMEKLTASIGESDDQWGIGMMITAPVIFSLKDKKLDSNVAISGNVLRFPLSVVGAYLPRQTVNIRQGTFEGTYSLSISEDLKAAAFTSSGKMNQVNVTAGNKKFSNVTVTNAVDANYQIDTTAFDLKRLETSLALENCNAFVSDISGTGNLTAGEVNLAIKKIEIMPALISAFTTSVPLPEDFHVVLSGNVKASEALKRYQAQVNSSIVERFLATFNADANLTTGAVTAAMKLSQCNEKLLDVFAPGLFTASSITGDINATGNLNENQWHAVGNFVAEADNPKYITEKVTGTLGFDAQYSPAAIDCRNFSADIRKGNSAIGDFTITALWPLSDESAAGNINLISKHLNLEELQALLPQKAKTAVSVTQQQPVVGNGTEPAFNFGNRSIPATANFQSITYQQNKGALAAQALLAGNTITLSDLLLKLNDASLRAQAKAQSTDVGIQYQLTASSEGNIDLATLLEPFLPEAQKGFKGTMSEFAMNFSGLGVKPPTLFDNLTGNLHMKFGAISVPVRIQSTLLGQIFFLPLQIFVQIQDKIPDLSGMANLTTACQSVDSMLKSMQTVDFTDGNVQISSANGRITIDKCCFVGPTVRTLEFKGNLGMGSNQTLLLAALLDFSGIKLPMEIGGTLSAPSVNIAKTVTSFLATNASTVLSVIDGAVNGTGNDDKGVAGVIGGLLQSLEQGNKTEVVPQNNGTSQPQPAEEAIGTMLNGLFKQLEKNSR